MAAPILGECTIEVPGGRVWCNMVGDSEETPLLLLHGGPGVPSHYLEPLRELGDERPVIFFDQLGCGRSERPDNPSLWTVDRFAAELNAVREALGLAELHLFGHSWGAMLALEHIARGATGVKRLILASPAVSVEQWMADTRKLIAALPADIRDAIERNEAARMYESEEYQAASQEFAQRHISLARPFPHPLLKQSMEAIGQQVYMTMAGASEFTILGSLRHWDRSALLPDLQLPILWTCGRHDEALPATVCAAADRTPNSRVAIFEQSAHMTMLDEPDAYIRTIRDFLRGG